MMRRSCIEALGLFLFAVAIAMSANAVRSDGLPLIRGKVSPDGGQTGYFLSLEQFLGVMKHPGIVILDARPKEDFDEAHVPTARSLPEDLCADQYPLVLQDLPFDHEMVVYCAGIECESAEEVAVFLQDMGYSNTKVFPGGWEEWEEVGLPVESGY